MKPREFTLDSGIKIFLGKDETNNDELVEKFKGKENTILHTIKPGSPFCVIDSLEFSEKDLTQAAIICASKSQDWRDNKRSVKMHVFTGKNVFKSKGSKPGSWTLVSKPKKIKIKKRKIKKWLSKKSN